MQAATVESKTQWIQKIREQITGMLLPGLNAKLLSNGVAAGTTSPHQKLSTTSLPSGSLSGEPLPSPAAVASAAFLQQQQQQQHGSPSRQPVGASRLERKLSSPEKLVNATRSLSTAAAPQHNNSSSANAALLNRINSVGQPAIARLRKKLDGSNDHQPYALYILFCIMYTCTVNYKFTCCVFEYFG